MLVLAVGLGQQPLEQVVGGDGVPRQALPQDRHLEVISGVQKLGFGWRGFNQSYSGTVLAISGLAGFKPIRHWKSEDWQTNKQENGFFLVKVTSILHVLFSDFSFIEQRRWREVSVLPVTMETKTMCLN